MSIEKKKYLEEVVFIRLILIVLLVICHAFSPYSTNWSSYPGMVSYLPYKLITPLFAQFRLPVFIFLSGYLFGYTVTRKSNALCAKNAIVKKAKRLLLPSIFFSAIYYVIFYDLSAPYETIAGTIVQGAGHMWFLPMLFWCFTCVFLVEKFHIGFRTVLLVSCLLSIYPPPSDLSFSPAAWLSPVLPMQLDKTAHYFIFFFLGYMVRKRKMFKITEKLKHPAKLIIALCTFYLLLKFIVMILRSKYVANTFPAIFHNDAADSFIVFLIISAAKFLCGICGVSVLYIFVTRYIVDKVPLTAWWIKLSSYCYGVYIYHQFILLIIYYRFPVSEYMHSLVIPWVATIVTILISVMLTKLTLQTRFGRYLIG